MSVLEPGFVKGVAGAGAAAAAAAVLQHRTPVSSVYEDAAPVAATLERQDSEMARCIAREKDGEKMRKTSRLGEELM